MLITKTTTVKVCDLCRRDESETTPGLVVLNYEDHFICGECTRLFRHFFSYLRNNRSMDELEKLPPTPRPSKRGVANA